MTRYAVVADIHGNLEALDATLDLLTGAHVDRYLCLGDIVGYGPYPNECVHRIAELGAVCVAGNHDLIALGRLPHAGTSPLARETLRWTAETLDASARAYLAELPLCARRDGVMLAHGSLADPRAYVRTPEEARSQLGLLAERDPGVEILLLGHTHVAAAYGMQRGAVIRPGTVTLERSQRWLLNPGSVGQSRQWSPAARAMILDVAERRAAFTATAYDVDACRRALRARSLPEDACHIKPSLVRAVGARVRDSVWRGRANR